MSRSSNQARHTRLATMAVVLLVVATACSSSGSDRVATARDALHDQLARTSDLGEVGITRRDGRPYLAVVICDATIDLLLLVHGDDKTLNALGAGQYSSTAGVLKATAGLTTEPVSTDPNDHRRIRLFPLPIDLPDIDVSSEATTGWMSVIVYHRPDHSSGGGGSSFLPGGPYPAYPVASTQNDSDLTFNLKTTSERACTEP